MDPGAFVPASALHPKARAPRPTLAALMRTRQESANSVRETAGLALARSRRTTDSTAICRSRSELRHPVSCAAL